MNIKFSFMILVCSAFTLLSRLYAESAIIGAAYSNGGTPGSTIVNAQLLAAPSSSPILIRSPVKFGELSLAQPGIMHSILW
ncbi:hypothetical protein P0Y35_12935 [Kiritimatiellaeota bacterium B1221]|nr:hypothetical protein [Kiritimatiellaeota bacterium B1221]